MDNPTDLTQELLDHQTWLVRLTRHLVANPADADAVVQETWVAALRHPPETDRPLRPWLATVARNAARQLRRGRSRREHREQVAARDEALPGADELAERLELQRELARMLSELDEPYRGTLMLRYVEGLSAAEIARQRGEPAGTIRWRLKAGLDQIRARLDDTHGDRNTWCLMLAPITASRGGVAVGAATPLLWILTMSGAMKSVAMITLSLLVGLYAWRSESDPARMESRPDLTPESQALVAAPDSTPGERASTAQPDQARALAGLAEDEAAPEQVVLLAQLRDAADQPLAGVRVSLADREVESAADGTVQLFTGREEFEHGHRVHLDREDLVHAERSIPAGARGPQDLGQVVLQRAGSLAGIVVDELGTPVSDAAVEAQPAKESRPSTETAGLSEVALRTGPDGRFELTRLPPGFHSVLARTTGTTTGRSPAVRVVAGETTLDVRVVVELLAVEDHVSGVVLRADGTPCPGARLEVLGSLGSEWADEEGRFLIHAPQALDLLAREGRKTSRFSLARGLQPGTAGHQLRLEPAPTLRLRVVDQDGQPVAAVRVGLHTAPEGEFRAKGVTYSGGQRLLKGFRSTSEPGRVEIDAPPLDFEVRVKAEGYVEQRIGPLDRSACEEDLEVVLVGMPRLGGRVTSAGEPVVGAEVSLHPRPDPGLQFLRNGFPLLALNQVGPVVETDSEGHFALPIDDESEAKWGWFVMVQTEDGSHARSELVLPDDVGRRTVELEVSEPGEIEGRLLVTAEEVCVGRVIVATDGYGAFAAAETDAQGRFLFEGLAPGSWVVRHQQAGDRVRMGLESQRVSLDGGGHLSGRRRENSPALEWSVVVRAGERAHFDLDLDQLPITRLQGSVLVDGLPPGPWKVNLVPKERDNLPNHVGIEYIRQSTALDDEGRFTVEAPLEGAHELILTGGTSGGAPCVLVSPLELHGGFVKWSTSWSTAPLSGSGSGEDLFHRRVLPDGSTIWTELALDQEGQFSVTAPSGAGQVARGTSDRPWLNSALELLAVDLPREGLSGLTVGD